MADRVFSYVDYDKISDDLYFLGGSARLILRMNVGLAKKQNNGDRQHFYHEYAYDSKYNDIGRVLSMRRSYDFYMTLESLEDRMSNIMIRPQDMILLRSRINNVLSWFNDNTFAIKKGKLYIVNKPNPIVIGGFPERKSISFEPVVVEWEDGNQSQGVRITLSGNTFSDISIDRFYGFVYIVNSINMVQSAQSMLAYMGRPDIGTNHIEFDNRYGEFTEPEEPKSVVKERTLPKQQQSYFDKLDSL